MAVKMINEAEKKMTIWEHLEDFRRALIKMIVSLMFFVLISLNYSEEIIRILIMPSKKTLEDLAVKLNLSGPFDAFWIQLKVSLFFGTVMASPFIFYFFWNFIAPALKDKEKKYFLRFVIFSSFLSVIGALSAYFSIPFLISLTSKFTIEWAENIWSLSDFISFCGFWILICGFISQTPVAIFALVKSGLLSLEMLRNGRPYAIVIIFIIAGLLTPPEPISQILMALPLVFLYEISIFLAKFATTAREEVKNDQSNCL